MSLRQIGDWSMKVTIMKLWSPKMLSKDQPEVGQLGLPTGHVQPESGQEKAALRFLFCHEVSEIVERFSTMSVDVLQSQMSLW